MFAYVLLYVPSGLQSTVSDTSCPHYSWSHHQHISSLCKHNKSWGPSRGTCAASGLYSGFMKVLIWLTQKQHSGYKERHKHSDLNLLITKMENLKSSWSDVRVQKLWLVNCWLRDCTTLADMRGVSVWAVMLQLQSSVEATSCECSGFSLWQINNLW